MPTCPCLRFKTASGSRASRSAIAAVCRIAWLVLFLAWCFKPAAAQQGKLELPDLGKNPEWFPRVYKPYQMMHLPAIKLTNSSNLSQMIRDGKLQISLSQLKTAVEENNLDILSSRNGARYAETDMLRAKGGGAPRGGAGVQIPSGLFAGAIGAGVGGAGGLGGFGSAGGVTGGARQVFGFPRGSYDPSLALGFSIDQTNSPLNSTRLAGVRDVSTKSTALQARYTQAFTFGSSISISFNNMRQSSTQEFLRYNPSFVSQLSFSFTQQLLSGFGFDVGRRFLDVAKNESKIMQENVRLQINTTLAQAENTYWDLVAARENFHVAEQSLEVAQRLYEDNKKKEEIGTASGLDVTTAESEVAARQRDLVAAQTQLQMSEADLKDIISTDLSGLVGPVQIEPIDNLPIPKASDITTLSDALTVAMENRPEIRQTQINLLTQDIAIRYSKDLIRPSLLFFANFNSSGLNGNQIDPITGMILPGGISQAMSQVFRRDFPEYAVGFSFSLNIRNRAAKADLYRARLEKQQTETGLQRTQNSIALEVRKAVIGLVQSKAQVEAAHKAAELSGELLTAEESKLLEGTSVPYEVIRRQRDLRSARFAEVQARVNYAKALVEKDRAMGVLKPNDD
jgi:outer membrane protein